MGEHGSMSVTAMVYVAGRSVIEDCPMMILQNTFPRFWWQRQWRGSWKCGKSRHATTRYPHLIKNQPQNVPGHSGKAKKGHLCFDAIYETGGGRGARGCQNISTLILKVIWAGLTSSMITSMICSSDQIHAIQDTGLKHFREALMAKPPSFFNLAGFGSTFQWTMFTLTNGSSSTLSTWAKRGTCSPSASLQSSDPRPGQNGRLVFYSSFKFHPDLPGRGFQRQTCIITSRQSIGLRNRSCLYIFDG